MAKDSSETSDKKASKRSGTRYATAGQLDHLKKRQRRLEKAWEHFRETGQVLSLED